MTAPLGSEGVRLHVVRDGAEGSVSSWTKLPAVPGSVACLVVGVGGRSIASGALSDLPMERVIAVGFGSATATCDDRQVYSEGSLDDDAEFWTVADVEKLAAADPDHDWRISFHAPLYSAVYQRQGDAAWVLVEKGQGFA